MDEKEFLKTVKEIVNIVDPDGKDANLTYPALVMLIINEFSAGDAITSQQKTKLLKIFHPIAAGLLTNIATMMTERSVKEPNEE